MGEERTTWGSKRRGNQKREKKITRKKKEDSAVELKECGGNYCLNILIHVTKYLPVMARSGALGSTTRVLGMPSNIEALFSPLSPKPWIQIKVNLCFDPRGTLTTQAFFNKSGTLRVVDESEADVDDMLTWEPEREKLRNFIVQEGSKVDETQFTPFTS